MTYDEQSQIKLLEARFKNKLVDPL